MILVLPFPRVILCCFLCWYLVLISPHSLSLSLPLSGMTFLSGRGQTALRSGFYFRQRNHQTAFHNHPLCQSCENCSSLHSAELITAAGSSVASFQSFLVLLEPILCCFSVLDTKSWGCPRWFVDVDLLKSHGFEYC